MRASTTKRSRSGRRPTSGFERLIAKVWYWSVRRTGWSDTQLAVEFIPDAEGQPQIASSHSKAFERTRRLGTIPTTAGRRHAKRAFDIVAKIDAHPDFRGTEKVMHSMFWDLLRASPGDLVATQMLIEQAASALGLQRVRGEDSLIHWMECIREAQSGAARGIRQDGVDGFEVALQRALGDREPDLELLTLLGALYREACLTYFLENAQILAGYFTIYLARYCEQPWLAAVGHTLDMVARYRVLQGDAEFQPGMESRLSTLETSGFAILVPLDE